MKLKKKNNLSFNHLFKYKYLYKTLLFISFVIFTLIVFVFGGVSQRKGYLSNIKQSLSISTPLNFVKGKLSNSVETVFINIKFKNFLKLEEKRNEALLIKVLKSDKYVPANIIFGDKKVNVNIRLKGDLLDHLEGKKWSFRIKTKGEKTIFGMKQFSIHHPKTRNYIYEWGFHKFLKTEGLIALRYKFIKVVLNGENLGIYAVEEHFEKRLIENNNKKAGPIIRFNEDLFWESVINSKKDNVYPLHDYSRVFSSNIDSFKTNDILSDSTEFKNFSKAISLLESFRSGEKSTREVFDIDLLSTFYAMIDLYGANHALSWTGLRYYYNPITSYLEPIGFDALGGWPINSLVSDIDNNINSNDTGIKDYMSLIFDDYEFYRMYIEKLTKFSEKSYLDSVFSQIDKELNENLNILYGEWPFVKFDKGILYKNQNVIKQFLNPPKAIQVYTNFKNNDKVQLSISNIQTLPVIIKSLIVNDTFKINNEKIVVLPSKKYNKKVNYQDFNFSIPKKLNLSDSIPLKIIYSILGAKTTKLIDAYSWDNFKKSIIENDYIRKKDNTNKFNFINIINNNIIFKSGNHTVKEDINIPTNFKVIIEKGTSINLINKASIISKSPVYFNGTKENPIIIKSSDSTGEGIFVLKAKEK